MRFGGDQAYEPTALTDRRQRARETFYDMLHDTANDDGPVFELADCVRGAIETATRVKITDDVIAAAQRVVTVAGLRRDQAILALTAALVALGFEVEE